jgi:hypothetical protein
MAAYHQNNMTLEPPITKASLSVLDLERMVDDPGFRHDLNFGHLLIWCRSDNDDCSEQQLCQAEQYWEALISDFTLYSHEIRQLNDHKVASTERRSKSHLGLKLSRLFNIIAEIMKTLIPQQKWTAVDERLDASTFVRDLENGLCDIEGLVRGVAAMLSSLCSAKRKSGMDHMIALFSKGASQDNARLLVDGLKELFSLLELLRLVRRLTA